MLYIGSTVSEPQKDTLKQLHIPFSVLAAEPALPMPLGAHPDMLAVTVGNVTFSAGETAKVLGCTDTGEAFGKAYPKDVLFNGFTLGNRLFCNKKSFSKVVQAYALACGMEIVDVRQGYAKCSTLVLGDKQIITADRGIAKAAEPFCEVLCIREGGITLAPYAYGFIGGASFILENTVYFFGNIDTHTDAASIRACIEKNGYRAVSLSDEPLCDCGGAIIKE